MRAPCARFLKRCSARFPCATMSAMFPCRCLRVQMFPKAGRSGGQFSGSLWILWDACYGEPCSWIISRSLETTSRIAPERDWASPLPPAPGAALRKTRLRLKITDPVRL